jgi:hypothetical protein
VQPAFKVGDHVESIYTLANGTQKWYSSKIEHVYDDGTYKIKFIDGETVDKKSEHEIRRRRRMSTGTFSPTNSDRLSSSRDSGRDSFRGSNPNSSREKDISFSPRSSRRASMQQFTQRSVSDRQLATGRTLSTIDPIDEPFQSPRSQDFRTSRSEDVESDDDSHDDHVSSVSY